MTFVTTQTTDFPQVLTLEAQLNRELDDKTGSRSSLTAARTISDQAIASGRAQSTSPLCAHVSPATLSRVYRPAMYGNRPRVVGLESCKAYRAAVPVHLRRWAPAGLFNCGTNTLLKLMRENCIFDTVGRHILWCESQMFKSQSGLLVGKARGGSIIRFPGAAITGRRSFDCPIGNRIWPQSFRQ